MCPGEKIITREEAKAAGLKHFFTGVPCKRNHVVKRFVSSGVCVDCARQRGRQRFKNRAEPGGTATISTLQNGKPEIISRKEAKAAGRKHYFTGEPCKRNHVAERLVSTRQCVECNHQWREDNAKQLQEAKRQWYEDNREQVLERSRQWYKDNVKPSAAATIVIPPGWELISRKEAKAAGRKWYFTGKPCPHDHVAERLVSTRACGECMRLWKKDKDYVEKALENHHHRYDNDPVYRLSHQLRAMTRRILNGNIGAGKLSHVPESRVEAVRAKIDADLAAIPGAPGSYAEMDGKQWHIDHVVPLRVMLDLLPNDETRPVLAYVVSHPDMLRPLPAAENMSRGKTLDADAQAAMLRFWEIVHEARAYANDFIELET